MRSGSNNWLTRLSIAVCLSVLSPLFAFADPDLPCDGQDPYADCPLDTWVYILFAATLLYGIYFINKHKKPAIK
jgi:hypothetical protein